jgi:chlorite dismutase
MSERADLSVIPQKGWHVVHLFYRIEHGQWSLLSPEEQIAAKTHLSELIQEIRATDSTQLLVFSMVTPKADLGFMLLTPDLHTANAYEKRLSQGLGPDVLQPVFSFLSLTEESEYLPSENDYARTLEGEQGLRPGGEEFERSMSDCRVRMLKYANDKLYPRLPNWEVFCFYPMTKRRQPGQNWYELTFEERRTLMAGHGIVGRTFHGKVLQLITGCTGLDDAEWGVSLFAHDTFHIKEIVSQMRFDPVSVRYAEFGEFYIGLSLPLDELFRRILL